MWSVVLNDSGRGKKNLLMRGRRRLWGKRGKGGNQGEPGRLVEDFQDFESWHIRSCMRGGGGGGGICF